MASPMSESEDYFGDVVYEVWRSGGNPDNVDRDECEDLRYNGYDPEEAAELISDHNSKDVT